jgi:uncharacterized protein
MQALGFIKQLQLLPHPEGGYYRETYRSLLTMQTPGGERNVSTAIYYLLEQGDLSAFHRIKSDECWHFYAGQTLLIHVIGTNGEYSCIRLGNRPEQNEQLQFVVPAGAWFASEPALTTTFALVGCTVAPGFDFADFEMADRDQLLKEFSQHNEVISRLCR